MYGHMKENSSHWQKASTLIKGTDPSAAKLDTIASPFNSKVLHVKQNLHLVSQSCDLGFAQRQSFMKNRSRYNMDSHIILKQGSEDGNTTSRMLDDVLDAQTRYSPSVMQYSGMKDVDGMLTEANSRTFLIGNKNVNMPIDTATSLQEKYSRVSNMAQNLHEIKQSVRD